MNSFSRGKGSEKFKIWAIARQGRKGEGGLDICDNLRKVIL